MLRPQQHRQLQKQRQKLKECVHVLMQDAQKAAKAAREQQTRLLADAQTQAAQIVAKAEKSAAATMKEAEARGTKIIKDQEEQARAAAKPVKQQVGVEIGAQKISCHQSS